MDVIGILQQPPQKVNYFYRKRQQNVKDGFEIDWAKKKNNRLGESEIRDTFPSLSSMSIESPCMQNI